MAYFLIAVLVPAAALTQQGEWRNFNLTGTATATIAGALGPLGAVCITYASVTAAPPSIVMRWFLAVRVDQRPGLDGDSSAESRAQSDAVRRLPAGGGRRRDGAVLPATSVNIASGARV